MSHKIITEEATAFRGGVWEGRKVWEGSQKSAGEEKTVGGLGMVTECDCSLFPFSVAKWVSDWLPPTSAPSSSLDAWQIA